MNIFKSEYILHFLDNFKEVDKSLEPFLNRYFEIIKQDKKKPLFSLTNRYSTFPKHKTDRYKRHNLKKGSNAWIPNKTDNNIIKTIKKNLNKISEKNYVKCTKELMENIKNINSFELFDILAEEIYQKCIYDIKYHPMFIYLCKNIWDSEKITLNTVTIEIIDSKYYWKKNIKDNDETFGPFITLSDTHSDIFEKINFQSILIDIFLKQFITRSEIFNNNNGIDTEQNFKNKYKIQSIFKFIISLFSEDLIDGSYLNQMFNNIINTEIFEEDIECIYKIIKLIPFPKYAKLEYYLNKIEKFKSDKWEKRTNFFFDEIFKFKEVNISNSIEYDFEYYVMEFLDNKIEFNQLMNEIKRSDNSCETLYYLILEDTKNTKKYYDILVKLYKFKKYFRKDILYALNRIIKDFTEFVIDVPNLHINLSKFINELSNDLNFTFCNNKFISNINMHISDDKLRAKLAVGLLNKVDRISDSAFEKLLSIVDNFKNNSKDNVSHVSS